LKETLVSRFAATFVHFLLSLAVFAGLTYLIVIEWFPGFFFAIDGGWEGMRIIAAVDLVLGPVLTLIVYKEGKPGLRFDLTLIGITQAVCLAAGAYVVYSERPIFFVYYDQHFYSSSAGTYTDYGLIPPDPADYGTDTPVAVYVRLPPDPIKEADVRSILFSDAVPLWTYASLYVPLRDHMTAVIEGATPIEDLRSRDEDGAVDAFVAEHGGAVSDYAFIPIHSRYRHAFLGIRKGDRSMVDILEVPPPL
jgi:hypothetical protein